MVRGWNKWKNNWKSNWGDNRDYYWQYNEQESQYTGIKKMAIAVIIFTIIYCAHVSDTFISQAVDDGVRYMVNTQTDFQYVLDQVSAYLPANIDLSTLKKVQTTITRPADPLQYMIKPANGKITANFGWYVHPVSKQEMMNEGIDIEAPFGANVYAAVAGKVKIITDTAQRGKTLILDHGQDTETVYGHLGEILVTQGEAVSQGQIIAKAGKTGMTGNPIVYFEVREKGKAVDPLPRLKGEASSVEGK